MSPVSQEHKERVLLKTIADELRLIRESQIRTEAHLAVIASVLTEGARDSRMRPVAA